MKHLALCGALAALLAALLAGCGAKTAASARPAGRRELKSTPPDFFFYYSAITEMYTVNGFFTLNEVMERIPAFGNIISLYSITRFR